MVFERADEPRERGTGLLPGARAVAVLNALGLAEALGDISVPVTAGTLSSWRDTVLSEVSLPPGRRRPGADQQGLLLDTLGGGVPRFGAECRGGGRETAAGTVRAAPPAVKRWQLLLLLGYLPRGAYNYAQRPYPGAR